MTSHLSWMVIRNNSAFLLKKRGVKKPFSTEPLNLTGLNSYKYNGLVHKKVLGINATADNKGFVVSHKKANNERFPVKSHVKTTFKAGARRSLYKLKNFVGKNKYRPELVKPALRKASAILRSQKKPKGPRKARGKKQE
ncbi:60S ribosomal protein L28 [Thrips palmi]|uniref:Large ribosomal subunit protein eL28 n=1 Tax=Thrips palmi TaxID=161013 RepID=A0A6P8XZ77_THRPL|nr:60S ribosomal protein L28 [Thrips palmi]XP_034232434.1 60S ribosomal protein L28 [Thrips palmi]